MGHRCGSDLVWLWWWQRAAAAALIWTLAWELPHAAGAALKKKTSKKKKKQLEQKHRHGIVLENCKCISILRTRYFCHTQKIGLSHSSSNCKCRSSGQQWVPLIGLQSTPVLSRRTVAEGSGRKVLGWGGARSSPTKRWMYELIFGALLLMLQALCLPLLTPVIPNQGSKMFSFHVPCHLTPSFSQNSPASHLIGWEPYRVREDLLGFCFVLFYFQGPHLWHMDVPRLGVKLELQQPAYTTAHGNTGSLTHWGRPALEPASSKTRSQVLNLLTHDGNSDLLLIYWQPLSLKGLSVSKMFVFCKKGSWWNWGYLYRCNRKRLLSTEFKGTLQIASHRQHN